MDYKIFATGLSILKTDSLISGIGIYSYNTHDNDIRTICDRLRDVEDILTNGATDGRKVLTCNVQSAPWYDNNYSVGTYGISGMFDLSIFRVMAPLNLYENSRSSKRKFRTYANHAMTSYYRLDDEILYSGDICEDMINLSHRINKLLMEYNNLDSSGKPSWM